MRKFNYNRKLICEFCISVYYSSNIFFNIIFIVTMTPSARGKAPTFFFSSITQKEQNMNSVYKFYKQKRNHRREFSLN